jgi:hypothetical protein
MRLPVCLPSTPTVADSTQPFRGGILGALGCPQLGMSDDELRVYLATKNPANIINPEHDSLH